jgi:glutathione peroxidase-family protein
VLCNVASFCALTPQYPALEALYEQFKDQGLEVIGVGCNQVGLVQSIENHTHTQTDTHTLSLTHPNPN